MQHVSPQTLASLSDKELVCKKRRAKKKKAAVRVSPFLFRFTADRESLSLSHFLFVRISLLLDFPFYLARGLVGVHVGNAFPTRA